MNLIEDNWNYIQATAAAKAVEIARHFGRLSAVEDLQQEILFYLVRAEDRYNPKRSRPKTFINMILTYAKKDLLRRMYRMKRRANISSVDLQSVQADQIIDQTSTTTADIGEFIDNALPEPDRTICRQVIIEGISAGIVARQHGITKDEILSLIREAMRPIAVQIGIRAANGSPDHADEGRTTPTGRGSSQRRIFKSTPGEVIPKPHTLSFTKSQTLPPTTKNQKGKSPNAII